MAGKKKSLERIMNLLYPALAVMIYILSIACIFDTFSLDLLSAVYNILLSLPLLSVLLMITRRYHVAAVSASLLAFAVFYVDQYVFSARLTHIRISDFRLIKEALRVAGRYPLPCSSEILKRFVLVLLLCAFLLFVYFYYRPKIKKSRVLVEGSVMTVLSVLLIISGVIPSSTEGFDFSTEAEQRGLFYSWYCQTKESRIQIPSGYSKEEADRILSEYKAKTGDNDVNVIVIMNESLADYSLTGNPRFDDPLSFTHSLKNSFEGELLVSVFGGCTATTEYEFLTGNSMAFLPEYSSPYLQYVNHATDNLTSELKGIGYDTIAVHPYYSEEWNRSQVYKFFSFDKFISGSDFGDGIEVNDKSSTSKVTDNQISFGNGPLYIRGLISDQSSYERVLEETTDRSFIFNVTMQNHGGYGYNGKDFKSNEYISVKDRTEWEGDRTLQGMLYDINSDDVDSEVHDVNQYLTCSAMSDKAFEYLIGELEKSNEKTIVMMFGDHQPGLLISEHYTDVKDGVDPDYTVPYIMWANYDIDFDAPEITSPNYLSAILKKNAGLDLTGWDQFRLDVMEKYPVMTANYILDSDGKSVSRDALKDYEYVQYMRMFER